MSKFNEIKQKYTFSDIKDAYEKFRDKEKIRIMKALEEKGYRLLQDMHKKELHKSKKDGKYSHLALAKAGVGNPKYKGSSDGGLKVQADMLEEHPYNLRNWKYIKLVKPIDKEIEKRDEYLKLSDPERKKYIDKYIKENCDEYLISLQAQQMRKCGIHAAHIFYDRISFTKIGKNRSGHDKKSCFGKLENRVKKNEELPYHTITCFELPLSDDKLEELIKEFKVFVSPDEKS